MADPDIAAIREQLQALADRAAVRDLFDHYIITIDTHDAEIHDDDYYRTIFTEDARLIFPVGSHSGAAGLSAFETAAKAKWRRTHHVTANCAVALNGDRATVRTHGIGAHVHLPETLEQLGEAAGGVFVVGCSYQAEAVRTAAGWRFSELTLQVQWTAGPSLPSRAGVDDRA
jgi:hypothetical protein